MYEVISPALQVKEVGECGQSTLIALLNHSAHEAWLSLGITQRFALTRRSGRPVTQAVPVTCVVCALWLTSQQSTGNCLSAWFEELRVPKWG
jgi:hypothetical protein